MIPDDSRRLRDLEEKILVADLFKDFWRLHGHQASTKKAINYNILFSSESEGKDVLRALA